MNRIAALGTVIIAAALASTAQAATTTTVNVSLTDQTSTPPAQGMRIAVDQNSVKAGTVRFHVTNQSKSIKHELIVVRLKAAGDTLPMMAKGDQVDEKKITRLGEVADLRPGKSGNLQRTLTAGNYLLICNEDGHFHQGMSIPFTVTK